MDAIGGTCAFAIDCHEAAASTFQHNHPKTRVLQGNGCKPAAWLWLLAVALILSGFPCQPFSSSGLQQGFRDARAGLLSALLNIAWTLSPPIFLLENVPGLAKGGNSSCLKQIIELFKTRGYHHCVHTPNAAAWTPQQRTRIFITLVRHDIFEKQGSNPLNIPLVPPPPLINHPTLAQWGLPLRMDQPEIEALGVTQQELAIYSAPLEGPTWPWPTYQRVITGKDQSPTLMTSQERGHTFEPRPGEHKISHGFFWNEKQTGPNQTPYRWPNGAELRAIQALPKA